MQPSLQKASVEGTRNGVFPLISNRNIIIRPNNPHIPSSTSKSVSQGKRTCGSSVFTEPLLSF